MEKAPAPLAQPEERFHGKEKVVSSSLTGSSPSLWRNRRQAAGRRSSVGKSARLIIERSPVQVWPPLLQPPLLRCLAAPYCRVLAILVNMEGHPEIIEFLNEALKAELAAINQYFTHSKMCENWGWNRLAAKFREESMEEMRDAEKLMDRILLLDGIPQPDKIGSVKVGHTPEEQLQRDLELEEAAITRYRRGIKLAFEHGDDGTRELLEHLLMGEEEHLDWIETQMQMIADIGIALYLQAQVGE